MVTAGSLIANVLAYLVQLPASRELGAAGYGEFATLSAAMLVLAVPALALQNVVARGVVLGEDRSALWRLIAVVTALVVPASLIAAVAMSAIAHTSVPAALAALAAAPFLVVIAGAQGLLQGAGRFGRLGGLLAVVGVLRSAPVIVAVLTGGNVVTALLAGTLGTVLAAVVAVAAAGRVAGGQGSGSSSTGAGSVLYASGVQLVIIVAVSLDLLLSRTVLTADDAGVYALGAVATKAAFWLPQAIGVVVYPRLADPVTTRAALRSGARVLAVIGGTVTVLAALAGPLVPTLVSDEYRPVSGLMWLFALTGSLLAVLQLLLLAAIARDHARGGIPASLVLVVEAVLILTVAHSVLTLAVIAAACAALSVALTAIWIAIAH